MSAPDGRPVADHDASDRLPGLDVARGVAILGTFAVNVWLFAEPGGPGAGTGETTSTGGPLTAVERILLVVPSGVFLALLMLLFGMGIELQHRAAMRDGRPWPGHYSRRALVLLLLGVAHYVLVFEFDILMGYAIVALIVAALVARPPGTQRTWMLAVGIPVAALIVLSTLGEAVAVLTDATPSSPAPGPPPTTDSWLAQVLVRLTDVAFFRAETIGIILPGIVLFLLGARLLREGLFDRPPVAALAPTHGSAPEPGPARLRRRLMVLGLGVALPVQLVLTFSPELVTAGMQRTLVAPFVAVGLLAGIAELCVRPTRPGVARTALVAVGRTALSCYVLGNVLASALTYDWGLGLAARFWGRGLWWPLALWALVCVVLVLAALAWRRRDDRGPLEWLVHRLA